MRRSRLAFAIPGETTIERSLQRQQTSELRFPGADATVLRQSTSRHTAGEVMQIVKLRYQERGLQPRRTKLEIPGWGGDRQPRAEGSTEQVWHCLPFSEGAQYGIEFFSPYANEL